MIADVKAVGTKLEVDLAELGAAVEDARSELERFEGLEAEARQKTEFAYARLQRLKRYQATLAELAVEAGLRIEVTE